MPLINGTIEPQFQKIKDAFAANFDAGLEFGSAVAVVVDGKIVANLWGGHADKARTRPWQQETLVNVWSVTKAVVALSVAMMVERGKLKYDRPLADVWPAFAQNGKGGITLDHVLSHQAGLNGVSGPIDADELLAWDPYVKALEEMTPLWEPGSRCVYHALSYGHLAGETLRRADGRRVSQLVQDEISAVLGVPFYIGLPLAEDHKVAEMIEGPKASDWVNAVLNSEYPHSCRNPTPLATAPNIREWRAAEIPGGNGHTNATALARIFGNLVGSASSLISKQMLSEATRTRFEGLDACSGFPSKWGAGFSLRSANYCARASARTFGHGGWGGSLAFGDPEARLGFAYVTNHMLGFDDGIDVRRQPLIEAVYDAL